MSGLPDVHALLGLLTRPEVLPIVLMVGSITALAALSLRTGPGTGEHGRATEPAEPPL